LTVLIAPYLGQTGKVYSTALEPARLADIRSAVARAGVQNVTLALGAPSATNLPPASCDGIFMREVYHLSLIRQR
jgi:precorrin-6B methylase 2